MGRPPPPRCPALCIATKLGHRECFSLEREGARAASEVISSLGRQSARANVAESMVKSISQCWAAGVADEIVELWLAGGRDGDYISISPRHRSSSQPGRLTFFSEHHWVEIQGCALFGGHYTRPKFHFLPSRPTRPCLSEDEETEEKLWELEGKDHSLTTPNPPPKGSRSTDSLQVLPSPPVFPAPSRLGSPSLSLTPL